MPDQDPNVKRAMASSRSAGAVGENPVVYRIARTMILPHHTILDYGAGKAAAHTMQLRAEGHNVTAHDYHAVPGLHDPDALNKRYHVVLASNVLNVQNTPRHLARTLNDIANCVDPAGGFAIVNMPAQPRYDAHRGYGIVEGNARVQRALKNRFGSVELHPDSAGGSAVWICRSPKHLHSK